MQMFCFRIMTTSSRLSGVSFSIAGASSGLLETMNIHSSKSSDVIARSINDKVLVVIRCLNRLIRQKS